MAKTRMQNKQLVAEYDEEGDASIIREAIRAAFDSDDGFIIHDSEDRFADLKYNPPGRISVEFTYVSDDVVFGSDITQMVQDELPSVNGEVSFILTD